MDRNGYIRIVGRTKEIIIRGGINVYPKEIEEVLITNPYIANAAVSGNQAFEGRVGIQIVHF